MKLFLFAILFSLWLTDSAKAQQLHEKGIHLEHTNYNDAFAKARNQNKNFFIDCYTTWCGPCKMMAANTFTDDSVGRIYNHFFVSYKLDMEHNEGPQLAPYFHIEAYPTFLFIRPNGDIFFRAMGYMAPKVFIETTLKALGADANLDSLVARSKKGKISNFDLISIMLLAQREHKPYQKYLDDYFKTIPQEQWSAPENFEVMKYYSTSVVSAEIEYLVKHKEECEKLNSPEAVNELLKRLAEADFKSSEKKKSKQAQKILEQLTNKK